MLYSSDKSILQMVEVECFKKRNIRFYVKRDDLIDAEVSGNKWRKLKYNIEQCKVLKKQGILTFGGAFSNHLLATASACNKLGVKSIGIVRGNELNQHSNQILKRCTELGMEFKFVSRDDYKLRNDKLYQIDLNLEFENYYIVPEGGANFYGMIGCQDIVNELTVKYDSVFVAQGTTTTSCGILLSLAENSKLHLVPVLKGFDSIKEMRELLNYCIFDSELTEELLDKTIVHSNFHFGGYAQKSMELLEFIDSFQKKYHIPLYYVYTGKVMYALFEEMKKGNLDNQTVVFIHTGGVHYLG